jgi:hypothetical protein
LYAIEKNGENVKFASERLKNGDVDFALRAVEIDEE